QGPALARAFDDRPQRGVPPGEAYRLKLAQPWHLETKLWSEDGVLALGLRKPQPDRRAIFRRHRRDINQPVAVEILQPETRERFARSQILLQFGHIARHRPHAHLAFGEHEQLRPRIANDVADRK